MTFPELILASTIALAFGSLLDRVLGDPKGMPHAVRGIGSLISHLEKRLLTNAPDPKTARRNGLLLVIIVLAVVAIAGAATLVLAYTISPWLGIAVESLLVFQCLAVKSLRDESMKVAESLESGNVAQARRDVAMIVGRDTAQLDEAGITRAAVETVAESSSDGVVAPLFAVFLAGGVGGMIYKAINTMDSMVGYQNQRYLDFGRTAARLDDFANWLPARLTGLFIVLAAALSDGNAGEAWRIWRRDHANHASPNSGHPEAACAGALQIQLGGPSYYQGVLHNKPVLGDSTRSIRVADIRSANRLMSIAGWLAVVLAILTRLAIWVVVHDAS